MRGPLILVPVLLLAGCFGDAGGPPVSARDVPLGAPSEAGDGPARLLLLVTNEPGGPGVPAAAVAVYWYARGEGSGGQFEIRQEVTPGGVVQVVDASGYDAGEPERVLALRTDSAGRAIAHVPADRLVGVVAWRDGWTEEWLPRVPTANGTLPVALYREELEVVLEQQWGPAAVGRGFEYAWNPQEVRFGTQPDAHDGYLARLAQLEAELAWTNAPTGYGDLALAMGPTTGQPSFVVDEGQQVTPGAQREAAALMAQDVIENGFRGAPALYAGPATRSAQVSPLGGIPTTLTLRASFDPANIDPLVADFDYETPLPGALVVVALAGAALVARRR